VRHDNTGISQQVIIRLKCTVDTNSELCIVGQARAKLPSVLSILLTVKFLFPRKDLETSVCACSDRQKNDRQKNSVLPGNLTRRIFLDINPLSDGRYRIPVAKRDNDSSAAGEPERWKNWKQRSEI